MTDPTQAFHAAVQAALGRAPEVIEPGRLHRFATSDKRGDDAGWCKLFADLRGGVFGCYRAGINETWQAERTQPMTRGQRAALARQIAEATAERDREQQRQWAQNAQLVARLWAQCVPLVPGDPVTLYLKRRGFAGVWPLPACLRLHRALPCWGEGSEKLGAFPTMVAPVVAPGGRVVALHRTYLSADGRKAAVPSPRKLTATAGPLGGACIRLHEARGGVVGIAEGIETALAAALAFGVPTVAAYSAGNLAAWHWPAGANRLMVFGDNDAAGRKAAGDLRARACAAGLACEVLIPTEDGTDWCDVWARRRAAIIEGAAT